VLLITPSQGNEIPILAEIYPKRNRKGSIKLINYKFILQSRKKRIIKIPFIMFFVYIN